VDAAEGSGRGIDVSSDLGTTKPPFGGDGVVERSLGFRGMVSPGLVRSGRGDALAL